MSERYTELYRLPYRYCLEGCPLYVEAGTLLKDSENGKVLVQLKICNLSKYRVTSCKVTINSYEPNGNLLETVRHQFMDVDGATGSFFGTQEPIYLSENTARKYDVCITEIVFGNDDVWTGTEIKWNEIDAQEKISDYFSDKELVEQFYMETGKQSVYVPRVICGIYQCACGTLNINPEYKCRSCKQEYALYERFLNKEYLKERLDERKEREFRLAEEKRIREEEEKARKEEEERQRKIEEKRLSEEQEIIQKKRRKIKRICFVSIAIIAFALILILVFGKKINRQMQTKEEYQKAQTLFEEEKYEDAALVFNQLSETDYKDSLEKMNACYYELAKKEMRDSNFELAKSYFLKCNNYRDAKALADKMDIYSANYEDFQTSLRWISKGYNLTRAKEKLDNLPEEFIADNTEVQGFINQWKRFNYDICKTWNNDQSKAERRINYIFSPIYKDGKLGYQFIEQVKEPYHSSSTYGPCFMDEDTILLEDGYKFVYMPEKNTLSYYKDDVLLYELH